MYLNENEREREKRERVSNKKIKKPTQKEHTKSVKNMKV